MKTADAFKQMRQIGKIKWTQRNGEEIALADMDCGHLRNAAKMIRRRYSREVAEADACSGYSGSGDIAGMYADHAADAAMRRAFDARSTFEVLADYVRLREEHGLILKGPR